MIERLSRKTVDGVTASSTVFRMATAPLMLVCTRIRYVTATNNQPAATSICPDSMAPYKQRTDHHTTDGQDPKSANFRTLHQNPGLKPMRHWEP